MSNLLKRSFSGIIFVTFFLSAILFSQESYILLVSFFGVVAIWELSKMTSFKSIITYILFGLTLFLIYKSPKNNYAISIILGINILSSMYLMYQLFRKKEIIYSTEREKLGLTIRYLIFSFCFLILLPFYNQNYTPYLMICVLLLIWVNDSFAFIVGKNFGKKKLFLSVSPKKTVEGFIGGFIFALMAAYIISTSSLNTTDFSLINWFIIASIVSIIGTIGDLVESKLKRQANIKDSGTIMPGHGGILDRLDSLLFAAPFVYLYINFII
jgi:phosphatidate cytidylyltransferase